MWWAFHKFFTIYNTFFLIKQVNNIDMSKSGSVRACFWYMWKSYIHQCIIYDNIGFCFSVDLIDFATESYVVALAMMICNFDETDDLFDDQEDITIEDRAEQIAQTIYEEIQTKPNIGQYNKTLTYHDLA